MDEGLAPPVKLEEEDGAGGRIADPGLMKDPTAPPAAVTESHEVLPPLDDGDGNPDATAISELLEL